MSRIEHIGDATLYLADCRDVMPALSGMISLITDPPYGVDFLGKMTKYTDSRNARPTYEDTEDNFRGIVLPAIMQAICLTHRGAIFTGTRRLHEYPSPKDIGGIVCPNGGGRSAWGFGCYHPVAFYGKCPYLAGSAGARPTTVVMYHPGMHVTGENEIDHPCPKPIAFMLWAVNRASVAGDTVFDPFMGSATTGVASLRLGRRFVGVEIEERWFDVACSRIENELRSPQLPLNVPQYEQTAIFR